MREAPRQKAGGGARQAGAPRTPTNAAISRSTAGSGSRTKRVYVTGSQARTGGAGIGANGQPLTGQERATGCHSYGAIMSGVCP